jgi:hypothetical protein
VDAPVIRLRFGGCFYRETRGLMMHRDWRKPECWTTEATPRRWTASDSRWCRAWRTRTEMNLYHPGCDGCARIPHLHDHYNGSEWG